MKHCANKKCGDWIGDHYTFCPACRFMGRWAFALGALIVGAIMAVIKLIS